MPNIKSAIKRVKVAEKKTLENSRIKSACKTAVRKYENANASEDKSAAELLKAAKRELDHAYSKGVITKNAAARKKSRLEKNLSVNANKEVAKIEKEEKKAPKEAAKTTKVATTKKPATKKAATKKATTKKTTKKAE